MHRGLSALWARAEEMAMILGSSICTAVVSHDPGNRIVSEQE